MPAVGQAAGITRREFGRMADGRIVYEYRLDNGHGLSLGAINYGGTVTAIHTPDRHGRIGNVVLNLASLHEYETHAGHFGALVGRYANRIRQGRFPIGSEQFQLDCNEGANSLHGGSAGFGRCWWDIEPAESEPDSLSIKLSLVSPDGDQGYPGELRVAVHYTLTARNEWRIDYRATCSRPTVINLTQHSYFNLTIGGSALDQMLSIAAGRYLRVDRQLIPLDAATVVDTPFDFRQPVRIRGRLVNDDSQLRIAGGYDHNWLLDGIAGSLHPAACLYDPVSGRVMHVETTEPGLQFYSGNFLDGRLHRPAGGNWQRGDGICLETQHYPDSPNRPDFPSTILMPGDVFTSTTVYRFGTSDHSTSGFP